MCLLEETDPSTLIILLVPPPELHLLLGPVNKLYDGLFKVWIPYKKCIKRLNIKREEYHGGSFNGNGSRKFFKNIAILKEISPSLPHLYLAKSKTILTLSKHLMKL